MTQTILNDVADQVQTWWSPMFMDELLEAAVLAQLVNRDYEGDLKEAGSTVRVSQIGRPTATRKTVDSSGNHTTFDSSKISTKKIDIVANQVITVAYDVDNLIDLQSQIGQQGSKIRQGLLEAMNIALNDYLFSLVAPSAASPDHTVTGVTDFNASALANVRMLASKAKWAIQPGWYCLVDPSYQTDLLNSTTLTSADFVPDSPIGNGAMTSKRFGFTIVEDNSAGMSGLSAAGAGGSDCALAFHPDFMYLVMQKQPTFELSSKHVLQQHGYLLSASMVVGATLGIDGALKHITVTA